MEKFLNLLILFVVLKSVVPEDPKSSSIYRAQYSNPSIKSENEINSDINFWDNSANSNFGNDEDVGQLTRTFIAETVESALENPELVAAFLEPDMIRRIPALVLKFERSLIQTLRERRRKKHNLFSGQKTWNSGFNKHRMVEVIHPLNRREKRSIPEVINFISSFLFSELQVRRTPKPTTFQPTTPEPIGFEPTTIEPTTIESTTSESLEDVRAKILSPKKEDISNSVDEMNGLVRIEDEGLKNALRDAIKTEDSDKRVRMYNLSIPEMKSDVVYVQKLSGSAADNTAAFLRQLETNELQNFNSEEYEQENSESTTEKAETEEKGDVKDDYEDDADDDDDDENEEEEDDA